MHLLRLLSSFFHVVVYSVNDASLVYNQHLHVCVCACVRVCVCVCVRVCVCVCVCVCVHIHIHVVLYSINDASQPGQELAPAYTHIHIHIYIYTNANTCTRTCTCTAPCIYTPTFACVRVDPPLPPPLHPPPTHTHLTTGAKARVHSRIKSTGCKHMHCLTLARSLARSLTHARMRTGERTPTHPNASGAHAPRLHSLYTYVREHTRTHARTHTHVRTRTHTHAHTHVRTRARARAHTHSLS